MTAVRESPYVSIPFASGLTSYGFVYISEIRALNICLNPLRIGACSYDWIKPIVKHSPTIRLNPLRIGADFSLPEHRATTSALAGLASQSPSHRGMTSYVITHEAAAMMLQQASLNPLRIGADSYSISCRRTDRLVMVVSIPFASGTILTQCRLGLSTQDSSLGLNPLRIGADFLPWQPVADVQRRIHRLNPLRIGACFLRGYMFAVV